VARCGAKPHRYADAFAADGDAHSADGDVHSADCDDYPADGNPDPSNRDNCSADCDAGAYRQRHAVAADCDDSSANADDGWADADVVAANFYFHSTDRHRDNCSAYCYCERDARAADAHAFPDTCPAAAACSWIPYGALW